MEVRSLCPADDRYALSRIYEESWKSGLSLTGDYLDDNIGGKALREISYAYHIG